MYSTKILKSTILKQKVCFIHRTNTQPIDDESVVQDILPTLPRNVTKEHC